MVGMLRGRAFLNALLGLGLGLLLSSHSCQVRACSGDCCDEHDDDCRHALLAEPAAPGPLLLPLPGRPVPTPVWIPAGR